MLNEQAKIQSNLFSSILLEDKVYIETRETD